MYAFFTVIQSKVLDCMKEELGEGDHKKELFESFNKLDTNTKRFDFAYEKLEKYNLLDERFEPNEKNDDKANEFKLKSTMCFSPGKYNIAINLCTKQIMYAKTNEMRASGYANRSAALFKLELYEECIVDADRAIVHNYPEKQLASVITRKEQAALKLREVGPQPKFSEEPPKISENQKNAAFPSATNSVSIQKDATGKRHVVATKDIQIGEVIVVEEPLAATIGEKCLYHCHECLNLCYNMIPCLRCPLALYCSEFCRMNAYVNYHQYECPVLMSLFRLFGRETCFLFPLKMIFFPKKEKISEVLKLAEEFKIPDTRNAIFDMNLTGAIIFDLVKKHTNMFEGLDEVELINVFKESIAPFLYYSMGHTSSITEYIDYNQLTEEGQPIVMNESFGFAMYHFNNLFGHRCCPNVYRHYHGTTQVIRASRSIKKGERCVATFGPTYNVTEKASRQLHLSTSYGFTCKCRACEEDWGQLAYAPKTPTEEKELAEVLAADKRMAKKLIPKKIEKIKKMEKFEPRADLTHNTKMLDLCYDLLGNRRYLP